MRVLFYYRGVESLGVGYLMSALKRAGHEIDLIFDPGLDDNLFLRVPFLKRLNGEQALLERAKAFAPDLICVSILTSIYPFAKEWCHKLKQVLDAPIVAGGAHVQALPDYVLSDPNVDIVCVGEGEQPLVELANRLERGEDISNIPSLWVKAADGSVRKNPLAPLDEELDAIAFPEKDLWYEYGAFHDNLEVFTGRGCPFRCTFCNIHFQRDSYRKAGGRFLRKRSVANVMEELRQNLHLYDPKMVSIHDDNFTTNKSYVLEFCEAYRREVNLPWYCFGYPTTFSPELTGAMAAANCRTIFMGVDSGSESVRRDLMSRPMKNELIQDAARMVQEAGVGLQISCIYGCPTETEEQMFETLDMVTRIRPTQCSSYVFYPLPRTRLHDYSIEQGLLDEEGQQMVREGRSGYHHDSILRHPHKDLAETLAKVTPLYAKVAWLRPLLRVLIRFRLKRVALALYVLLIPFIFPHLGLEGVTITLKMAYRSLTQRAFKPRRRAVPQQLS
jgi:anaerobic magnesium-protoporphyrin IX monomethyl ester cyclase